ncbi:DUF2007 domain-containing protein [Labilibacter sediminis]|nr:DUF2007 domain-containing protein [Labilibacter sediminis]
MRKLIYGHIVEIEMYKDLLEKSGIECFVKNEFEEASHAGFGSGLPGNADLFVDEQDLVSAEKIVKEYKESGD